MQAAQQQNSHRTTRMSVEAGWEWGQLQRMLDAWWSWWCVVVVVGRSGRGVVYPFFPSHVQPARTRNRHRQPPRSTAQPLAPSVARTRRESGRPPTGTTSEAWWLCRGGDSVVVVVDGLYTPAAVPPLLVQQ